MKVDVLTLFPGMFGGAFSESILRIAREKGHLDLRVWNLREFASGRHRSVDDRPYGGGAGMIFRVEPVFACVEYVLAHRGDGARRILLSPQGPKLTQERARRLAGEEHLLLLCGRYEGLDERIRTGLRFEELSIGDYVLSGGEIAAMVVVDAVARLLPGVLGSGASVEEESFSCGEELEYPQYTRPVEFRGMKVPDVLVSGHHEKIKAWRRQKARRRTAERQAKERSDEETCGAGE